MSSTPMPHRPLVGVTLVLALLFGAPMAQGAPGAEAPHITADRARIQAHLALVEAHLLSANTGHLAPGALEARRRNIERLRGYRLAGVFPHNTHRPYRTPVFIDREGRACAVGYLMRATAEGRAAAADVARLENLALVPDIRSPKAARWIAQSGLTLDECALIQPSYNPPPRDGGVPADSAPAADTKVSGDKGAVVVSDDDGGCVVGAGGFDVGVPFAVLALLALGLRRRR